MLLKPTEIFIDLDMLFDMDFFVCDTLYNFTLNNNDPNDNFYRLKTAYENTSDESKKFLFQIKNYKNPLYDFMYMPDFELADKMYNAILYNENNDLTLYSKLVMTKVGKMIKVLLSDNNLVKVNIYAEKLTDALYDHIYGSFTLTHKINIVTGNKAGFIKGFPCDEYFFSDVKDLNILIDCNKVDHPVTVYITEYKYNVIEGTTSELKTPIKFHELREKHNILLLSIKLPITE